MAVNDTKGDIKHLGKYLETLSSGRLNSNIIDAIHLRTELMKIQKDLSPTLAFPENPANIIWHFYKYLTITPVHHYDRLIMLIKIPLVDADSIMILYKIYNLPIFHPHIGKSLQYNTERDYLAITKDRNYVTLFSEAEFVECILAQGHFCTLKNAQYHARNSDLYLSSLFLRNDELIERNCKLLIVTSLIRLLSLFEYMLEDSGSAENKEILLFSHDKLSLASILRLHHQVTKEMLV